MDINKKKIKIQLNNLKKLFVVLLKFKKSYLIFLPASSVQQKTSVWYPAVRTIWHQSCTDLGWLYHSSDSDRISADVQKCKSGIRTDRCESDPCGKNTWYAGI